MGGCFRYLAAAVLLSLLAAQATAEIQCSDAVSKLLPCQGFLLSSAPAPSAACCAAAHSLQNSATPADRKALCYCFKNLAKSFPVNIAKAQQIPKFCHVTIGVPINPNIDCNSIDAVSEGLLFSELPADNEEQKNFLPPFFNFPPLPPWGPFRPLPPWGAFPPLPFHPPAENHN